MIHQWLDHPLTYQLRRRSMTLEDLEARIGDDQGVLRMWAEQGNDPPLWVVCAAADALRVLPEHLMGMPPSATVMARGGVADPTAGERVAQLIDTVDVERQYLAQLLGRRFPARRGVKPRMAHSRSDIVALAVDVRDFVGISRWGAVRDLASVALVTGKSNVDNTLKTVIDTGEASGLTVDFRTRRLVENYAIILQALSELPGDVQDFASYFLNSTGVTLTFHNDPGAAHLAFIKKNALGARLSEFDQAKAEILILADGPADRRRLSARWDDASQNIHDQKLAGDRVLRLVVATHLADTTVRKSEARPMLVDYAKTHGPGKATELLENTLDARRRLFQGLNLVDPGRQEPAISGLVRQRLLHRHRQLHPVLLAGATLRTPDEFTELARMVADLIDYIQIADIQPPEMERAVSSWASLTRQGRLDEVASAIHALYGDPRNKQRYMSGFMALTADGPGTGIIKRILGRMSVMFDHPDDYRVNPGFWDPETVYTPDGWELEHIHPKSRAEDLERPGGADPAALLAAVESAGNLVLLEKRLNRSVRDKPFDEKKKVYGTQTKNNLTRAVVGTPFPEGTLSQRQWCEGLRHWETWTYDAIRDRHAALYGSSLDMLGLRRHGYPSETRAASSWRPDIVRSDDPAGVERSAFIPQTSPQTAMSLLLEASRVDPFTAEDVRRRLDISARECSYALKALQGLGLVEDTEKEDGVQVYGLTDLGAGLAEAMESGRHEEAEKTVARLIMDNPAFAAVLESASRPEAVSRLSSLADRDGATLGNSTAARRCVSIVSWIRAVAGRLPLDRYPAKAWIAD